MAGVRVSELIALLQQSLEQDGDLEAVVCGLDQCGYLSVSVVDGALPVVVSDNQIVCEYEDQKGPNDDHLHVTYIG